MKVTQSAGGVVLNPRGQVLVVNQNGNSWSLPKGHLDPDEGALAAAKREIHEESGVRELVYLGDLGTYERYKIGRDATEDRSERKTITLFLFRTSQTALKPLDKENPEARWVDKEKVAGLLTHAQDKEFFLGVLDKITALADGK